jgi:hypothetical protein
VIVIERGAVAKARVIESKRAGAWGRAGKLGWALEDVVAVDGTRVPIQLTDQAKGANSSAAVTAAAIGTGALLFPYTAPAALIWALKKGDEAVLDESQKSTAAVRTKTEVTGVLPEKKGVVYHSADELNATKPANNSGLEPSNNSFRPTPIRQR